MGGEDEAQEWARRYAAAWRNTKGARSGVADGTPPTGCENRAALTNQVLCELTQLGLPSTEMLRSLLHAYFHRFRPVVFIETDHPCSRKPASRFHDFGQPFSPRTAHVEGE